MGRDEEQIQSSISNIQYPIFNVFNGATSSFVCTRLSIDNWQWNIDYWLLKPPHRFLPRLRSVIRIAKLRFDIFRVSITERMFPRVLRR
jgi:hypothetical protein